MLVASHGRTVARVDFAKHGHLYGFLRVSLASSSSRRLDFRAVGGPRTSPIDEDNPDRLHTKTSLAEARHSRSLTCGSVACAIARPGWLASEHPLGSPTCRPVLCKRWRTTYSIRRLHSGISCGPVSRQFFSLLVRPPIELDLNFAGSSSHSGEQTMGMLDGKVAIITGGTSGIGKRIAEVFVAEGARIVVGARRTDEGQQLERELGESARFIRTDVSDAGQVNAMINCAVDHFGRIDCLVNNAGSPSPMVSIVDVDMDDFDRVMAINVRGVMLGMKLVVPHMIRQGSGSIINISSGAAIRVCSTAHTYCASKAAVSHLTRSVAGEVGRHGIRVNSISPGAIATGIFGKNAGVEGSQADQILDVVKEIFTAFQPIPRSGIPDDIADAAAFLASDRASFIHGHELLVDGGATLGGQRWDDGVAWRAKLYGRIREAIDRPDTTDAGDS